MSGPRRVAIGAPSLAALLLAVAAGAAAATQAPAELPGFEYPGPPSWQRAAVVTLTRHLPTDSGYFALGPIDPAVEQQDSLRLVRTTVRVLVPGSREARTIARRLWVPTGGVALQDMQPADSLPHELPPGYPGRFLRGTLAGQFVYLQVMTVRQHRWLVWADRVLFTDVEDEVRGPLARYSEAIARYLEGEGGGAAPRAADFGLDRAFDFFGDVEAPVIRDRAGYLRLLEENRTFSLADAVHDVYGVVPAPRLREWLSSQAQPRLVRNVGGSAAFQRAYREYEEAGGGFTGLPILDASSLARLRPGRYAYAVDRYGLVRVGAVSDSGDETERITPALLVHNDPVRAAGELRIEVGPDGEPRVASFDIRSEEYLFSNLSLSIYEDVERRSDRFLLATAGHVLRALADADVPLDETLIRKF